MSDTTTQQQPSKFNGQFHSIKGTLVEVIGNLFGWTSWTESGRKEHEAGEAETTAAQAQAFAEGTVDRIVGRKDAIVGAIVGDEAQQIAGNVQHDKGKAKAEANAPA
ncbi:hypothetical protein RSOLAG22IIIB_11493 [Rhizoctonia solani]|uniref:CsbD-like domain-containing protein n=1 Tax=Rhizoctonia solani TaxID=456999 RepID=A0A0K6G8V8_9AGAM|nr:hypothetical protein RSOLAG22IIIB_11493 [Rhizoctonia solani]